MGLVGRLLSFARVTRNGAQISDAKVDPGGAPNVTAENFAPPGDDSHPLITDYAYISPIAQRGRYVAIGYIDPISQPQAQPGDKRIYARNTSGAAVLQLWLKNTGEAVLSNDNGSATLQANGDFLVNGVTIKANGDVTIPNSLNLNGKEIAEHSHSQAADSDGDSQQDTGPNL